MRICFVCLGNICRSPMAEGAFEHLAKEAGLSEHFHVESAGLGPWHVGEPPDSRAQQTARAHGVRLDGRAQQFRASDFDDYDLVVALDEDVAAELRRMAPRASARGKVRLLREHDPQLAESGSGAKTADRDLDVPDPYYGGQKEFELAYQMIERSCRALLQELSAEAQRRGR
jgi:protein-tyrosine phosphatase